MADEVPSRELRNHTRGLLRRAEAGEDIVITVAGKPVATLTTARAGARWMTRHEFAERFVGRQADAGLRHDLDALTPDTTDDLTWR